MLVTVLSLTQNLALAASPIGSTETFQQTVQQSPAGADNGQQIPPSGDEEVIPPPPGDEDIYTDAPNPNAGHEKEVIPPSPRAPEKESSATPR
jgi:hypothetical protein